MRYDRTDNVKKHLLAAAKQLREEAEAIERDVARIENIEDAEKAANYTITRLGFSAANALASVSSANNWADDHRQHEILDLKEAAK